MGRENYNMEQSHESVKWLFGGGVDDREREEKMQFEVIQLSVQKHNFILYVFNLVGAVHRPLPACSSNCLTMPLKCNNFFIGE